ncbi:Dyp-type peroxidase [Mycolicibacterium goodii]|uniref:Dyp-type peroxidase n=1 Tax=Mycolicibacterium goodii TaxID=134601 RepID=UPI000C25D22D|nr:Dyp-type peroxidase [Mycolicibacterium goodii]PJK21426.1 peroxidase [Mycolicibacterium goodii]
MPLELDDIQGIVLHGYGALDNAAFLLLRIDDVGATRRWLTRLPLRDSTGTPAVTDTCTNIAFTPSGLLKLGLPDEQFAMLAGEFREGMSGSRHRRRILGDHGTSCPSAWRWDAGKVDVLLMLYARDATEVAELESSHRLPEAGVHTVGRLDSLTLPGRKEHFGFRDGISQPAVAGYDDGAPGNTVAAGEFLLGYPNAYGQYTDRPVVDPTADPHDLLPLAADQPGRRDLGKNGSYLVFRQLRQDVAGFWNSVSERSGDVLGTERVAACVGLAAKMVGRWPSGAPLVKTPTADNPALADDNDFMYFRSGDGDGFNCPIGAHLRRSNPRDALDPSPGSDRSIDVGKRHRIIRRGRAYGPPLSPTLDPADMIGVPDDGVDRGLHFICFNTQIGRQFEFIQHTWANSTKFDGGYAEDDPITGARGNGVPGGTFTVQREPVRRRVTGLPRFVDTVGGAYFFMPGIRCLRYLAAQP